MFGTMDSDCTGPDICCPKTHDITAKEWDLFIKEAIADISNHVTDSSSAIVSCYES